MRTLARSLAVAAAAITLLPACDSSGGSTATQTNPGTSTPVNACEEPPEMFTVDLPLLGSTWPLIPTGAANDSIRIPNGRPIYALFVTGYESNRHLDELFFYKFARHLMARGAYVHYAWWNNLLAPYMERPLHHPQSYPGNLDTDALAFTGPLQADRKAFPGEDYQFVADAKLFLSKIREHNPGATIIVAGHSMGGGSIVHLAAQSDVVIDILAPIDPTNNRNYPWAGLKYSFTGPSGLGTPWPFYNWTRWRVTRDNFRGFQGRGVLCNPLGFWVQDINLALHPLWCVPGFHYDPAPTLSFGSNIINLHHRYQHEAKFPYDFADEYWFGHSPPPGSVPPSVIVPQASVTTKSAGPDDGGWPASDPQDYQCCEPPWGPEQGVAWPADGHPEIVGYRGPVVESPINLIRPVALGTRVRTSPQCGSCPDLTWPSRVHQGLIGWNGWSDPNWAQRKKLLMDLEGLPPGTEWEHRPTNPDLCLVSQGLIDLFDLMNRPPQALAGDDRNVECTGQGGVEVVLDGSGSSDPDGDTLTYSWTWPSGSANGQIITATLPVGSHCITLTVRDPSGHMGVDVMSVTVQDTTRPNLAVALTPNVLSPPNNMMVDIQATVEAEDLCGEVVDLTLVSITGNGINTTRDIAGAEFGTLDLSFQLRAALSGGETRVYRVTYQATDGSGNRRENSASVTVPAPPD